MVNNNDTLQKIKQKGFWKLDIHPLTFNEKAVASLTKCKEIIQDSMVSLRGWPYPFYEDRSDVLKAFNNYIQCEVDFLPHIEIWRLYTSGLFVHYIALIEDWMDYNRYKRQDSRFHNLQHGDILGFDLMVYDITEIFEFIARLSKVDVYSDGVKVKIELSNIMNRKLFIFDFDRVDFLGDYKTSDSKLSYETTIESKEDLLSTKQNALKAILHFVERFNWNKPNIPSIQDMQRKLLERRL